MPSRTCQDKKARFFGYNEIMLYLTEDDVRQSLTMADAMLALESAFFAAVSVNGTANHPRQRFFLPNGVFHHMAAALPGQGVVGTKTYTSFGKQTRFYVQLFSSETGDLLAYIEADTLGQIRTGAATGVAAKYLAPAEPTRAALLGSGFQAETQVEALLVACPTLTEFSVFSRSAEKREPFCQKMRERFPATFTPMEQVADAVIGSPIVVCATTAREPILKAEWLGPGTFVAAVGANRLTAREIEEGVVGQADVIAVDDIAQAQSEAAELIYAYERRVFNWNKATPLAAIVAGLVPGRTHADQRTLFKSLGIALEDVAVARQVLRNREEEERESAGSQGQPLPL